MNHKNDISEQKEMRKIFYEQESAERKSSSVVLSKYNLESQCIVSISLFDHPEYYRVLSSIPTTTSIKAWIQLLESNKILNIDSGITF